MGYVRFTVVKGLSRTVDQVGFAEPIAEIISTAAVIILLNFYPHLVRMWSFTDGVWWSVEMFTPAFFSYIPYWTVIWSLKIGLDIFLLRQGRWQVCTRWASIALGAATILLAVVMLAGPALVQLNTAALCAQFPTLAAETAAMLINSLQMSARIVLAIIIVAEGIDIFKTLYRMFFPGGLAH